ncbi:unnamed protein product [Pseudo-nitzschia multistriata]|uniref:Uncharacterized protein n=1 Tax=Pseudo-nitzschia multistriata TaxID=183589 RepID=A0A448ZM55_9STRA|nr:unnamed protein product [Pseudo-nitzschia multistriata]
MPAEEERLDFSPVAKNHNHHSIATDRAMNSRPPARSTTKVLLPFLAAALLASLAATLHSLRFDPGVPTNDAGRGEPPPPPIERVRLSLEENPRFERSEFTLDTFPVGGVDLALFGLGPANSPLPAPEPGPREVFDLFADFDLSPKIVGNETWVDLLRYRRDADATSLSFYVDKVARKRWLRTRDNLDGMEAFVLKYGSELLGEGDVSAHASAHTERSEKHRRDTQQASLEALLPVGRDYAAKPTHLSCAGGVWLTKTVGNTTLVGHGKKPFAEMPGFGRALVAGDLADRLQTVQESCGRRVPESLALRRVKPGVVVEERFASWEASTGETDDDRGGTEFKVFTIWGRVWLAVQRPGMDGAVAILHRNGTHLAWSGKSEPLPDWIDWPRIVAMAEESGRNKDMFRTDVFVGVPAGGGTPKGDGPAPVVRYVVSESEIHPTEYFHVKGTQSIFNEGGRLWLAGYASGNYRVVPNTEVPPAFVEHGMLPEAWDTDAA